MSPKQAENSATHRDQRDLIAAAWRQVERVRSTDARSRGTSDGMSAGAALFGAVLPPDFLPGYHVEGEIHRGGQGVVYEAQQKSTGRTVAIKVMRDGPLAGPKELARFEREVQVLAQLKHPNIVTIHDSGRVGSAAYFVMDYIDGYPLDRYVARKNLSLRERLRLMAKICAAVNFAHLRGIIHRDLKPGNVRIDHGGEPHVLDFGLAKLSEPVAATRDELDAMTLMGQFVGSLPWASPEQAEGQVDEIDVRTDVYSLGVVLYQLLTGTFPYPMEGSLRETANHIVHTEARNPRQLNRHVDEELATIVLKALRKEQELRYQSAGELGRDLERYLAGEPIEAKRDSITYIFRKRLARHKVTASVAAAFVALVTIGLVVSLSLWQQAAAAWDAERQLKLVAQRNEARAVAEAAKAQAVSGFLQDLLMAADPAIEGGANVTVKQTLDAAAQEVDGGSLADQPLVEAAVHMTIGRAYLHLGLYEAAAKHLQTALKLNQKHLPMPHMDIAGSFSDLGRLALSQGHLALAEEHYRTALEILDALGAEQSEGRLDVLNNYALLMYRQGKLDEAQEQFERLLEVETARYAPDDPKLATTYNNLGLILKAKGELDRAEELFNQSLVVLRAAHGNEHVYVAAVIESLGAIALGRQDLETAERLSREALDIRRRVLGPEHPEVASGLNNLGYTLFTAGKLEAAEPYYQEALALRRKVLGDNHPLLATSLNNLGLLYVERGEHAAAEPLYREALQIKRAQLGENHPSTLLQMSNLAALLRKTGRAAEAEPLARQAAVQAPAALPEGHRHMAAFRGEWGACLAALARYEEAEPELLACYEGCVTDHGATHGRCREVADELARLCDATERPDEAAAWRARAAPADTTE